MKTRLRMVGLLGCAIGALAASLASGCGQESRDVENLDQDAQDEAGTGRDTESVDTGTGVDLPSLSLPDAGLCGLKTWDGNAWANDPGQVKSLSGYTHIKGYLSVESTSLANLKGLESLRCVDNTLKLLNNNVIENLDGLNNLARVGTLDIENNDSQFKDFSALSKLEEVMGDMTFSDNFFSWSSPAESLEGFEGLKRVGGSATFFSMMWLTTVHGLRGLEWVGADFVIQGCGDLQNLDDLGKLTHVGRDLKLYGLTDMKRINGLTGLTSIPRDVNIANAYQIEDLSGMDNLGEIGGEFILDGNAMVSLNGLGSLTSVGGKLSIVGNEQLTDISSLCGLESVGGLFIGESSSLPDLHGLEGLHTINGELCFTYDPILENVDGLSGVTSVNSFVQIGGNPALRSLDGLDKVTYVGGNICISNNPSLPNCEATEFRDRMVSQGWGGQACFHGNLPDECPDDTTGCSGCSGGC